MRDRVPRIPERRKLGSKRSQVSSRTCLLGGESIEAGFLLRDGVPERLVPFVRETGHGSVPITRKASAPASNSSKSFT